LARASIAATIANAKGAIAVLKESIKIIEGDLERAVTELYDGVNSGKFVTEPAPLFKLRIRIAEIAAEAVQLELQASGGRAYHRDQPLGFSRRLLESAFVPIVTPSIVQLKGELLKHQQRQTAANAIA